ncbi:MAG: hypothetical protein LBE56_14460 [Tannerella sp.]|nr:hypothetical protein [Tannerella sp.]
MGKPTIKIFISSPSDVVYERQIAKRTIAKLGKEFAASVTLEALLWEDMPLQATSSFQEGIDRIVNANLVDIAVFILWSRLGTPLDKRFLKPDGSAYKSGTEYEFDVMYAANQQTGTPSILAYIKNAPITDVIVQSSASAGFDFEEIGRQLKEAQRFIHEKFYDPETKTVYGAYHQFEAPTSFEQKLTEHLRRLIIEKIGHDAAQIEWEGNPYVGLRSFKYDENAIFFGRRHTINLIEEKVNHLLPDKAPSLIILGESGSGKSSLVRAGLLPDMIEYEWIENTKWKWFDLMPSQFRGNIYQGIRSKLGEAFPVLLEKEIGKDLMMGKEVNFSHLADILPSNSHESVLFFIDQFEEVFTDPLITEEERLRTFNLLRGMVATRKIWMIFSMRNDFYHRFIAYPQLSELKNDSIVFDLPNILRSELQEIVEEPAKKAGLRWEVNEQGMSLNKTIIHDINKGVDDLPLIEFALSELYNLRDGNNVLTFKAYEEIGKIDGAVVKYVDNFHLTLTEKEKELFYQILSALIAPSVENKNVYVRKTALLKDLQKSELHKQLIDRLINKHILISGKDEKNEATVTIVHEILISSWKVIQDWIGQEKFFIDTNNHYENLSKYWIEHYKPGEELLQGNETIKQSEYFLCSWVNNISRNVKDFLFTSIKKKRRAYLPLVIVMLVISVLTVLGTYLLIKSNMFTVNTETLELDTMSKTFLRGIMVSILLCYLVWKKVKAAPLYATINVSLIFWASFLVLSILLYLLWKWVGIWTILFLILPKVALTYLKYREIMQWKKRIYKKRFAFITGFFEKSSKTFQQALRVALWVAGVIMVLAFISGGFGIYFLQMENNRFVKTKETVDQLFDRLNHSTTLSESDRLLINKKQVEYLRNSYENDEKDYHIMGVNIMSSNLKGWLSPGKYYDYALLQYGLGYPEDFEIGINECIRKNSLDEFGKWESQELSETTELEFLDKMLNQLAPKLSQGPETVIAAAYETGMTDDCRKLIDIYKNTWENNKEKPFSFSESAILRTAVQAGLFELVKTTVEQRENQKHNAVVTLCKAHALLMTGEREKALAIYRQLINSQSGNWSDELKKDFAVFRWSGFDDSEILAAETALQLSKINVLTRPADETDTTRFAGNWQFEAGNQRTRWEIRDNNHQLGHYAFQTKRGDTEWIDEDFAVTRFRIKEINNKTMMEEYNVRTNTITLAEIMLLDDNKLQVKAIDNGSGKVQNESRTYIREK